jgi:hypothetical protein
MNLFAAHSHYNQSNPSNKRNRAENRRNGNGALLFMGDLNRPQIDIFLFMGEINSPYGEPNDSYDYEDDSDNGGSFHVTFFLKRTRAVK